MGVASGGVLLGSCGEQQGQGLLLHMFPRIFKYVHIYLLRAQGGLEQQQQAP